MTTTERDPLTVNQSLDDEETLPPMMDDDFSEETDSHRPRRNRRRRQQQQHQQQRLQGEEEEAEQRRLQEEEAAAEREVLRSLHYADSGFPDSGGDDSFYSRERIHVQDDHNNNTDEDDNENAIIALARRLRCLFGIITWPIVPLGTLVALALTYFLYAAFFLRNDGTPYWATTTPATTPLPPCAHPLHAYAVASLLWGLYVPYHRRVRARLVRGGRGGSGSAAGDSSSAAPRRYDQMVHTLALLYVYMGITLLQTCQQQQQQQEGVDTGAVVVTKSGAATATATVTPEADDNSSSNNNNSNPDEALNACQATCPVLTDAAQLYVTALELFTLSLVLPLLFLPCIYLWFLRQATANQEALAQLQQRLRWRHQLDGGTDFSSDDEEDTDYFFATTAATARRRRGGAERPVSADQILRQMARVKLVQELNGTVRVDVVSSAATAAAVRQANHPTASSTDNSTSSPSSTTPTTTTPTTTVTWEAKEGARECCICMSEFYIHNGLDNNNDDDIETGNPAQEEEHESVVRTPVCGHLFHEQCIANWVGGRWEEEQSSRNNNRSSSNTNSNRSSPPQSPRSGGGTDTPFSNTRNSGTAANAGAATTTNINGSTERQRLRRARRTTCPLCRADLWQSNGATGHAQSYGTF